MIFITCSKDLITYFIHFSNNSVTNFLESLTLANFHWATQITIKAISRPGTVKLALILVPRTRIECFFTFVCDRTVVVASVNRFSSNAIQTFHSSIGWKGSLGK